MKNYLLNLYRKLPLDFRKKVKNIFKKEPQNKEVISKENILFNLKKYDIISFDIFDTLITRCVYEPDDIFKILNEYFSDEKFLEKRKLAEGNARNFYQHDVNLDEIYEQYAKDNNISLAAANALKKAEINIEKEMLIARNDMLDLLKKLHELNKRVIIVSDMYLPKKTITEILDNCGYKGLYEQLYVSNDIGKRKDDKSVWPFLKEKYPHQKIIHLGDNDLSDVTYPKEFGIDTVKILSSKELLHKCSLYPSLKEFIDTRTCSDSYYLGLLFNKKLFNSPFSPLMIDDFDDFVYMFHAPVLTEFLKFVIDSNQDNLLFLAREGYYFTKLYDKYCAINKIEKKNHYYFLASRKATNTASIKNDEDIFNLLKNDYNGTLKNFLMKNFHFNYENDDFTIKLPDDYDKVAKVVKNNLKNIKNNIKNENSCYKKYIKELIPNYKKIDLNLIDLGYSGSIQYNLSKMLDKGLNGYYLTNSSSVKKYSEENHLHFYFDINDNTEYQKIYHYSLILEYFLTAPYGQLQYFKEQNGKVSPVYNDETLDEKKKKNLNKIYDIITIYFNDLKIINKYLKAAKKDCLKRLR